MFTYFCCFLQNQYHPLFCLFFWAQLELAILLFLICIIIELEIQWNKYLESFVQQFFSNPWEIKSWLDRCNLKCTFLFSQINIFFNPKNKFTKHGDWQKKLYSYWSWSTAKRGGGWIMEWVYTTSENTSVEINLDFFKMLFARVLVPRDH